MQVLLVITGLIRVKKYHPLLLNADRTIVGNALIIGANLKIRIFKTYLEFVSYRW